MRIANTTKPNPQPGPAPTTPAPAQPQATAKAAIPSDSLKLSGAKSTAIWSGTSNGNQIDWNANDITVKNAQGTFSLKDYMAKRDDIADMNGTYTVDAKVLAASGAYLSESESWDTFAGMYPETYTTFNTLDMGTGKPVKLTDLFPEDQIRQALLADPLVQKALQQRNITSPAATLSGVLQQLDGATVYAGKTQDPLNSAVLSAGLLDHFALYQAGDGQVGVRVVLDQPGSIHNAKPVQLGLTLPMPTKLQTALGKAAAGQEGALMNQMSKLKGSTHINYKTYTPAAP